MTVEIDHKFLTCKKFGARLRAYGSRLNAQNSKIQGFKFFDP
jgi:hypothetical protein